MECHRLGVCRVDPNGRPCSTVFERQRYDGTDSIVACEHDSNYLVIIILLSLLLLGYPKTGRMHQIRVHLQWLGMAYLYMICVLIISLLFRLPYSQ